MADQKISQLTEKQTLGENDLLVIASGSSNYKVKGSTVKTYAQDGLATVATTGDYDDLTDKPTIPTVNNATLTITQNGVSAGTFTANASTDATIAITETVQSASSPLSITSNALSIATADTSTSGALTSTDWNTFNGKQDTITASAPLDLTSNTLTIATADTNTSGAISSTDWNTFNNKAAVQTVTNDTSSTTATLALDANKLYTFETALTALTISSIPTGTYETEIQFTTDTGFTFTDNALTNKWLGVDAPTFEDGSSYVIAIKNGYGVCAKVGA